MKKGKSIALVIAAIGLLPIVAIPAWANPKAMGPGEHYVADESGSIIGLVTFGDEVIGFSRVLADQDAVQEPEWEVNTAAIPPMGTSVTLVLKRFRD